MILSTSLLHFRAGVGHLLGLTISLFMPCRSGANHPLRSRGNLERSDVALIDQAEHNIDIAAYVLTDWPVMQALIRAAQRGVKIRIACWLTFDASQKLPNRRTMVAHGRRKLFGLWAETAR